MTSGKVIGLDVNAKALEIGRERCKESKNVELLVGNIKELVLDEKVEVMTSMHSLSYISSQEELESYFRGIFRNLKEGGRFVCIEENSHFEICENFIEKYGIYFREKKKEVGKPFTPVYIVD